MLEGNSVDSVDSSMGKINGGSVDSRMGELECSDCSDIGPMRDICWKSQ